MIADATARERYERLRSVYRQMVGRVYPSIAYRDLRRLWEENDHTGWSPLPPTPRYDGSVPYFQ